MEIDEESLIPEEVPKSFLYQVPLSPEDVRLYKRPSTQAKTNPLNCGFVTAKLLRLISDSAAEIYSLTNQPSGIRQLTNFLKEKNPAGIADVNQYAVKTSDDRMSTLKRIKQHLYKGFATVLIVRVSVESSIGHSVVLARSDTGEYYILDPQLEEVITNVDDFIETEIQNINYIEIPEKTKQEYLEAYTNFISKQTPLEQQLYGGLKIYSYDLSSVKKVFLDKLLPVFQGCFSIETLTDAMAQTPETKRLFCISDASSQDTLLNPTKYVKFTCIITKQPNNSLYISHVCIPPQYRGGGYLRIFTQLLATIQRGVKYTLIASNAEDQGLNLNSRVVIYSRLGFYIPQGTVVRLRTGVEVEVTAVRHFPLNPHGQNTGYVFTRTDNRQLITGYERDIMSCVSLYGCPMETTSEILALFSGLSCPFPPVLAGGRGRRHTKRTRRKTKKVKTGRKTN